MALVAGQQRLHSSLQAQPCRRHQLAPLLRTTRPCRVHASQESDALPADDKPSSSGGSLGDLGFKAFVSEAEWRRIDKKVNKYPGQRTFTAIGTGGDDFKATMLAAVEGVVGSVHVECVSQRPSSGGKYVSVRIGPVWVQDADQVVAVFNKMREDQRLKWYM
ncbi:hypothetical protein OEZ86_000553 [Tetradesmus obliquus]|uniref:Uncharacterized protein n=1 Tax=Tetradesmus obliquus TaxID=3088 RepID=A0A383VHR2_TETOB|nr:hypothetical protein OEZ86_000553 [Tetradesmus obliquus]|eukprot:jgi/Sobl393_1/19102/SZX64282.1